jgi:hypothetical protein
MVGCATLTVLLLLLGGIAGAANGSKSVTPPPVDFGAVDRLMELKRAMLAPFVGEVEFRYEFDLHDGTPVVQHGTLYVGSDGARRMDLWVSESAAAPSVVAVAWGRAWLVLPGADDAHEAAYPVINPKEDGSLRLLEAQARQAEQVSRILLSYGFGEDIHSAHLQELGLSGDSLGVRFLFAPNTPESTSVSMVAEPAEGLDVVVPARTEFPGSVTRFADFAMVGDDKVIPLTITTTSKHSGDHYVWHIDTMTDRDPHDPGFLAVFDSASHPKLRSVIRYGNDGASTRVDIPL